MKKALAALLAIAMVVTGFLCLYPNASEANAATTTTDHGTFKAVSMTEWKDKNKRSCKKTPILKEKRNVEKCGKRKQSHKKCYA